MRQSTGLMLGLALLWAAQAPAAALSSRELDRVPLHSLPLEALQAVQAHLAPQGDRSPPRLAISVPMSLGLSDGSWSEDGDTSVWRARLYSAGATVLIADFDRFNLPPGAELRVSDIEGRVVQGPYTARDRAADGGLWTAMVPGEEALLELRVPTTEVDAVDLHLGKLAHGVYRLGSQTVAPKSGACNIDVVCPAGDGWRNQIRSAVRLQIPLDSSSVTLCSGQLVNNTAQDGRPYILTATHCGITESNAGGVVAFFNYQTSVCNGTPDGSLTQNRSGSTLLFSNARYDHTLIQLNNAPPSTFKVFYSGFDSSAALPQSGIALHHPNGEAKRISVYNNPASRQTVCLEQSDLPDAGCLLGVTIDAYAVRWSAGVTEPGSSGGGLWNQNQQLVGVLSGGNSSCSNTGGTDYFGRLDLAWGSGLSGFLDPGNTGLRSVCGTNPGGNCSTADTSSTSTTGSGATSGSNGGGGGGGGGSFGAGLLLLLAGLGRRYARSSVRR